MSRRQYLLDIEKKIQTEWEDNKVFQATPKPDVEKYFVTFPYPYMNGRLHLGHIYSFTKSEIQARYQRLLGKNVLWPFGLHCTGMPIQAAADKLRLEYEELNSTSRPVQDIEVDEDDDVKELNEKVYKGSKKKIAAKTGGLSKQSDIMRGMGIPEDMIMEFRDPMKWLEYFPPKCLDDLRTIGPAIDFRRSFITTERNPYYDSFVTWQFNTLKDKGYIGYGMRPTVYSPKDNQPCLDHDRSSGEGAVPQQYTLIKVCVETVPQSWIDKCPKLEAKKIYIVCATLRPETVYGQTNIYVLPRGEYVAIPATEDITPTNEDVCARIPMTADDANKLEHIYITSKRSAWNMAHQGMTPLTTDLKNIHILDEFIGFDLIGTKLKAPLTPLDSIYVLPMTSISMDKGTGIVTSVPSDSPDDYVNFMELRNNKELREKYKVEEHMVAMDIIEIIDIPDIGTRASEKLCKDLKIKGPQDVAKLKQAKEEAYRKGFYEGTMIIGDYKGEKVVDAKNKTRQLLLDTKQGVNYLEPDKKVVSRSQDICVVALLNQWYLKYSVESWKKPVRDWIHSDNFNCYNETTKGQFKIAVDWLQDWACSRSYGLGTRLPWEKESLVESLSDSVVYYAYYTICHKLHTDVYGDVPAAIRPEELSHEFWNYVFDLSDTPPPQIDSTIAKSLRDEFKYWYPMNMRCSGKDLIFNHLTMSLYHHEAIWSNQPHQRQNQTYFTNGHVLVDGEKMSKSLGNFMTLTQAVADYTADGVRIGCANAGDTLNDANFERSVAENSLLKLHTLITMGKSFIEGNMPCRDGEKNMLDKFFEADLYSLASSGSYYYKTMKYREALRSVFYDMLNLQNHYEFMCKESDIVVHRDCMNIFLEVFSICASPIAPHAAEYIYRYILKKNTFVADAEYPDVVVDQVLLRQAQVLKKTIETMRRTREKSLNGSTEIKGSLIILVRKEYLDWQKLVIKVLSDSSNFDKDGHLINTDTTLERMRNNKEIMELPKKEKGLALGFGVHHIKEEVSNRGKSALEAIPFSEKELYQLFSKTICAALKVVSLEVVEIDVDSERIMNQKNKDKIIATTRPLFPQMIIL